MNPYAAVRGAVGCCSRSSSKHPLGKAPEIRKNFALVRKSPWESRLQEIADLTGS
jgi:hypothetical protein